MALTGTRTYVGFGFGAIQSGLFLYEAFRSGSFRRLVVAEVLADVVALVREARGYTCNVAHSDGVEQVWVGPVEIEDPATEPDRARLVEAIAGAEEIGTAIPSVALYVSSQPGSLHRVLVEGLRKKAVRQGPRAVVYTAENHNHAAEILESHVMAEIPAGERDAVSAQVRFLNTVIGKMSGLVTSLEDVRVQGLATVTPASQRAFLVEAFNRILVSKIQFDDGLPFRRGIEIFEEKADLLPFEEAKLYGHNATHALAAYIGAVIGVQRIADLGIPGVLPFLRSAFVGESGTALVRRHAGVDPLFTPDGYREYADDLLARMTNPYLQDTVERVGRDPQRKLGWNDRLIGTIRVALGQGVKPSRYAFGAAAALSMLTPTILKEDTDVRALLTAQWRDASPEKVEEEVVLDLVRDACRQLRQWYAAGLPDLEDFSRKWVLAESPLDRERSHGQ